MMLELYVWSWMHLHPGHVLKTLGRFLLLSVLILLPLFALNRAIIQRGFMPDMPSREIHLSKDLYPGDVAGE